MLPLTRPPIATRLACTIVQTVRYSSSIVHATTAPATAAFPKNSDPDLERRRAARLTREAKQAQVKAKNGPLKQGTSGDGKLTPGPKPSGSNTGRPRKLSRRDRVQSSNPARGTERSRKEASQPGAAEAIMAFSRHDGAKQPKPSTSKSDPATDKVTSRAAPEPVVTNIAALLDAVPNLTSSFPPLSPAKQLREARTAWIKRAYGGDYSQWQLDSQSYLKGVRGPRSIYAKIILDRNPTISSKPQKELIALIKRSTKEA
ncbi:hypothetical protein D9756_005888 [Leucocoprinus leucothites]|uniref:Uncharacterized protein n=1 Tax=Leucocoprinus leucothites TaxID=201217 RepID=A0A8H5D2N6_9AGAR|nr:hypothetical protein D9756_005888 [Leucoagaricus leucothites]